MLGKSHYSLIFVFLLRILSPNIATLVPFYFLNHLWSFPRYWLALLDICRRTIFMNIFETWGSKLRDLKSAHESALFFLGNFTILLLQKSFGITPVSYISFIKWYNASVKLSFCCSSPWMPSIPGAFFIFQIVKTGVKFTS